jgi:hypothetical protein
VLPISEAGRVRVLRVSGPCVEEVLYKTPIGILYGLSITLVSGNINYSEDKLECIEP